MSDESDRSVAWAVVCGDFVDSTFTDRDEAVEWACGLIPPPQVVPLYRSPSLTDEEREAIVAGLRSLERALWADPDNLGGQHREMQRDAATLHRLLERLSSTSNAEVSR